jgi:peptidoglycan/xylan/chitin deacetylase (PgdA/CDA1 family)/glycosyltransferase involved in cell wall biosynthesis
MLRDIPPRFCACTIVARNYLPYARVLARSFAEHHPGETLTVLVTDDPGRLTDETAEPFTVVHLDQVVPAAELSKLVLIYGVKELATAVKPLLLRRALNQGFSVAMYLDPDIEVFAPLFDVASLAERHSIVLTPHTTAPMARDKRRPTELDILAAGVYNLGFLAVSAEAFDFLDWWWDRLRRDCVIDPGSMLFVDQRWIDFVPGYFDHVILRDPGVNLAYWNVDRRQVVWREGRYEVDGRPLRFFHFSGFSPEKPWMLTTHFGSDRVLLSESPVLNRLCGDYMSKLEAEGYAGVAGTPYGWSTLPCGAEVLPILRSLYREAILCHEAGKGVLPPDPLDDAVSGDFVEWLNEPVAGHAPWPVSRFLLSIYLSRTDVQKAYPDLAGADAKGFLEWVWIFGKDEHRIPLPLMPPKDGVDAERPVVGVPARSFGANVIGYFRAELGVGEAGRLLVAALTAAGVSCATRVYSDTLSRQDHVFIESGSDEQPYGINVLCVNADQTPAFAERVGRDFFGGRYTVGVWFWEAEQFPEFLHEAFEVVDEIWVASDFIAGAIRSVSPKPVTTIPLPILQPGYATPDRARLGLPGGFLFLYTFDLLSVAERKNPLGALEAFTRAFAPGEGPTLILKSINGDQRRSDLERLRMAAAGRPDVVVWDGYLSPEDRDVLMASCDCYVSLHRSEGFGLTVAEATAMGKPVIATAYSGNMSFMEAADSYLVDYELVPIPPGCEPYPVTARWAEPDLDQAAAHMRAVVEDPEAAGARGWMARNRLLVERSPEAAGEAMRRRLLEIDALPRRHASVAAEPGPTADDVLAGMGGDDAAEVIHPDIPNSLPKSGSNGLVPHTDVNPLAGVLNRVSERIGSSAPRDGRPVFAMLRRGLMPGIERLMRPQHQRQQDIDQGLLEAAREAELFIRENGSLRRELDGLSSRVASLLERQQVDEDRLIEAAQTIGRLVEGMRTLERAGTLQAGDLGRFSARLASIGAEQQVQADRSSSALILTYHRVAEEVVDPWGLCVTPQHFEEHMDVLRSRGGLVDLDRLSGADGRSLEGAVAVTLDDGYDDTLTVAAPLLSRYGVPATVFVMTAGFDGEGACWWDVLTELLLRPGELPEVLRLNIEDVEHEWKLGPDCEYGEEEVIRHRGWRWEDPPPTARHATYLDIWRRLRVLPVSERTAAIDRLRAWAEKDGVPPGCLLTRAQTKDLSECEGIEIGGHTIHHPPLPTLDAAAQALEIEGGKEQVEEATGRPTAHFAYPHGDYGPGVAARVRAAGFTSAATTDAGRLLPGSDPFALPRVHVPDLDAAAFARWLDTL